MYIGRTGLARGTGADGAGGALGEAAASAPLVVNGAPQYRQNRDVSLFIVPHASQRIERSRARIPAPGALNFGSEPEASEKSILGLRRGERNSHSWQRTGAGLRRWRVRRSEY